MAIAFIACSSPDNRLAIEHGKATDSPEKGEVEEVALREALEERYLAYALSTIMNRALPDARDGLKPVHRRILYGMRLLRLDPGAAFKKSAKVVGDVMGNFHPHGDQAIYDALVRLAQDFAQRYPLVDGQGNFGNIDGDNAAAMRYTEARLTEVARLLIDGIDEDAVDFRATYDGTNEEPVVLPAAFPNLLANGSQGIAVGMATSIPPHNAAELCDAALFLIDNPKARSRTLLKYVKGPDFPTGGVIVDTPETIAEAYTTGRGSFRVRARWKQEDTGRGTYVIVISEIPWLVQKSRLVEKLAELINEKKLPLVADVRDELAEDIRLVIEPRSRSVDAELMMESLFKLTELETRIPLNMNVLVKGRIPQVLGLAEALREWLDHRREVLLRRSKHRLAEIEHRLEVLGGYLVAYLNLDKVIKIIRKEDEPKPVLMKTFKLSDVQADAILNMRLRNLRKLEEMEIRAEDKALREERTKLKSLIGSTPQQWKTISAQIKELKNTFGPKTDLGTPPHHLRHRAGARRSSDRRGDGGARADHRRGVGEGLDPRIARSCQRFLRRDLQDRRRTEICVPDRDHSQDPDLWRQRQVLHASRLRNCRAGAAMASRFGSISISSRMPTWWRRSLIRAGASFWWRATAAMASWWRRTKCLGTTRKGKQVLNLKAPDKALRHDHGRRRTGGGDRRKPQDGDFCARPGARNGPRARRAAAALQGKGAFRRHHVQGRRRALLDRQRWSQLYAADERAQGLARQSRRCRPHRAKGLPEEQQVPQSAGWRESRRATRASVRHKQQRAFRFL